MLAQTWIYSKIFSLGKKKKKEIPVCLVRAWKDIALYLHVKNWEVMSEEKWLCCVIETHAPAFLLSKSTGKKTCITAWMYVSKAVSAQFFGRFEFSEDSPISKSGGKQQLFRYLAF